MQTFTEPTINNPHEDFGCVDKLPMMSFSELKGKKFVIPTQQRGYKWTPDNIKELISDLWEFINAPESKRIYCLQPLAMVDNGGCFSVLDGQQRLTTLFLLYKYLTGENAYTLFFERDEDDIDEKDKRWQFLSNIGTNAKCSIEKLPMDQFYIYNAYNTISGCFASCEMFYDTKTHSIEDIKKQKEHVKSQFIKLLNADAYQRSVKVLWYKVPADKAHETFRNLNSGKISLTNTELIKALLLNRCSGLETGVRENAARQFEEMERTLEKDHFWYMVSSDEASFPQTRMDLLFNLVANVSEEDAAKDFRKSFRWFADIKNGNINSKWKQVRHTYLRLLDLYENMYAYHYIGFLAYSRTGDKMNFIKDLLKENRKKPKSDFTDYLRKKIRSIISNNDRLTINDFAYDNVPRKSLRQLFLLHNIESLLCRYEELKQSENLELQHEYEQFPFELLNKQHWDIEHIASQTDSDFKNEQDRKDWLNSVKADYPAYFDYKGEISEEACKGNPKARIKKCYDVYSQQSSEKNFKTLYSEIIKFHDQQEDTSIKENDKNLLGNLVLLDSHTNRSFHNSLFPRKRRIVIIANGLSSPNDEESGVVKVYIPPCTMQCFTKAYSKNSHTKLNAWLQPDADAYVEDIKQKLCDTDTKQRYFK